MNFVWLRLWGASCLLASAFWLDTSPAHAFKPKTHVWVGQQVLNDVFDGCSQLTGAVSCVTIVTCVNEQDGKFFAWTPDAPCRAREYAVAPEIVNSLTRHPGAYRAGHIGPDTFPDLVVGQSTAHPGLKGGWQADDWMDWVLNGGDSGDEERAFAYGYLGHAAGDVFAHTYVNTYSGDIFDLMDGEQTVERRHIALEDYIDRHTPVIADASGTAIPAEELLRVPAPFLARHLILSEDVNGQYRNQKAAAPHLLAIYGVFRALEEAEKVADIPGIDWKLLSEIAELEKKAQGLAAKAHELGGPIAQAKLQVQAAQHVIQAHDHAISVQEQAVEQARVGLQQLIAAEGEARRVLTELPSKKRDIESKLEGLDRELRNTAQELEKTISERACDWLGPFSQLCKTVTRVIRETNPAYSNVQNKISEARGQLADLVAKGAEAQGRIDSFLHEKAQRELVEGAAQAELARLRLARQMDRSGLEALQIAERELHRLQELEADFARRINEINAQANLLRGPLSEVRAIRAILRGWRQDVHRATEEYIRAGREAGQALIEHRNPLVPYKDWLSCWGPVFTGIPSEISRGSCGVVRSIEELQALIATTRKDARDQFGETGGWFVDPLGKLQEEVEKKLVPAVESAAVDLVGRLAGREMEAFASLLVEEYDAQRLNDLFAEDDSNKNLLLISNMAHRADADMGSDGKLFSPETFVAARNAVVLSKLALLNASELNRLAKDCGWRPGRFAFLRRLLYRADDNVLVGAVRSIDGDHQWNWHAPLRLRRNGKVDTSTPADRAYGYGRPRGFRLWNQRRARELAFLGIFQGPIAPGIADLIPPRHPYRPSREIPFPVIRP